MEQIISNHKPHHIAESFFNSAEKFGKHPAVGMAGDDRCLSYTAYAQAVSLHAASLNQIQPQEPVGILSENRPEWGQIYLAILTAGGVVVPIDSLLKKEEIALVIDQSHISILYVSNRYYDIADSIISEMSQDIELKSLEEIPEGATGDKMTSFPDKSDQAAALIFTSGTTGGSKKVILTHGNILSDVAGFSSLFDFKPKHKFLSVLPLHHTFEATCGFLMPIFHGCAIYYVRELNSREILQGIKKHGITHFISVPLLYEKIYSGIMAGVKKAPAMKRILFKALFGTSRVVAAITGKNPGNKLLASFREKTGLGSIEMFISGGAPLPPEIPKNFGLMGFSFVEGYGLTETSPVLTVNLPGVGRLGSVGKALPNAEINIDQPNEAGVGEIIARGPMITPGYADNPEATADLIKDGWLHTGDLGRIDDDGFLFIVGRKKSLIVSAAGKNIYPEEIEGELLKSSLIFETIVVGKKSDSGREEVQAFIHPDMELVARMAGKKISDVTIADIKNYLDPCVKQVNDRIASYKRIKHVTYEPEELVKTSTKKIKRFMYQK